MRFFPDVLPIELGILLFTVSFVLFLSPYLAGHDLGFIRIPGFSNRTKVVLRVVGPFFMIASIALHLPLPIKLCETPVYETVTDAEQCGTATEQYVSVPETARTCRHESFGRAGWEHTETIVRSSGWMGGGFDQNRWCNAAIAAILSERSIGPEHEARVVNSREEGRWTGFLGRERQYKYHCTVEMRWIPIYAESTDAAICGTSPAVIETREIPDSCEVEIGTEPAYCTYTNRR